MKKTVLITGASGGLGAEFAKIFARCGYDLVLVARSEDKLAEIKNALESRYGVSVRVFCKDLSEKEAAREIYMFTKKNRLHIDILVNNAGFGDYGKFVSRDLQKQYEMIQVNVTALVQLTHYYMREMARNGGGRILNVASIASFQPGPLMSVYYASKAFVLSFTEALSVEMRGSGVYLTALCPGPTKTGFEERAALGRSGLFKNVKNSTASEVAEYGFRKLMSGSVIAVPGALNRFILSLSKHAPRSVVRRAVYLIQK